MMQPWTSAANEAFLARKPWEIWSCGNWLYSLYGQHVYALEDGAPVLPAVQIRAGGELQRRSKEPLGVSDYLRSKT